MATDDPKKKSIDSMLRDAAIEKFGLKGVMDEIEKVKPLLEQVAAGAEVLKGADGKTPELGKDYLTEEEQKRALELVRPVKGKDYNDGEPGKDGYTPVRGLDYMTDDDAAEFVSRVTPKKGKDYFTPDEVNEIKTAVTPKKGVDYNDGTNPTPSEFIEAVKSLKGKDAAAFSQAVGAKIDISHVRNAGSFIFNGKTYKTEELMHGGGSGGGSSITLETNGTPNGSQTVLNLVAGSNVTLTDNGSGNVTIAATGGGGGTPGGLNTQLQYNNAGSFGGVTGAVTDGTALSLTAPHLLNPTINGAGAGLATLVYPNTASNATITVPATTGTLALLGDLTGFVTAVTGTSNRITSSGGTTPAIDIAATYVGQTSITTLGTITTGTWSATTIGVAKGGTGVTTIAAKSIWLANSVDTITSVTPGASQSIRINSGNTAWEAYTPTAGTVTSVSGTSARITSTGGATPVIDIDAAYVGQSSITTLGTIATGTWAGTTIAVNHGGTGQTSYTDGQLLIGNTSGNTLTKATLTQGTGITITNAGGSITIASSVTAVTAITVASANGFAGSSSGGSTPALTLTTTVNSPLLAGNGTAISAATTTGSGSTAVLATTPTITSPTIQTAPVIAAATNIKITVPSSDGTATGEITNEFNSGYSSTAIGDLVYLDSSGTWQKADADASAATYSGMLGMALSVTASGAAATVLLRGFIYAATPFPTFTIGSPVYMSATAGAVTQTAPVTTDSATRILGYAVHADKMWFSPSNDWITHA